MLLVVWGPVGAFPIAEKGTGRCVIVLPEHPTAVEQTAARELRDHLAKVTGATLPVYHETNAPAKTPAIFVGAAKRARSLLDPAAWKGLGTDGIVLRTVGNDVLILSGGSPRGVLYAVYTFLEDTVGCRWWTSRESFIPRKPTLVIPKLDTVYTPPLRYREAFYRDMFNGVFAARCKCNGHFERIPPEYGGHYTILGWCHTFNQLVPPDKYFAEHPEWFSEIDGRRVKHPTQLCLTNPGVRRELTKNALAWIRKRPGAGFISISQNDWGNRCRCPACRALEAEEGAPSGPLLRFVNAVAEAIEKEYPDVSVMTLAYHYTRRPPRRVRPRRNVIIRLCSIECSFCEPLETGRRNQAFREDIEQWSRIAPHLYIWNYVTNFRNYILPHPNLRVLGPNLRFFVKHGAIGVFEQGDAGSSCGDFVRMRAWVLAHLLWDPSRDEWALIHEFLHGYYGPAAEPIRESIALLHDAVEKAGIDLRCFMPDTREWLPYDTLVEATRLFDRAEARVKGDPVLFDRVRRARMPLDHVWLQRWRELRATARREGKPFAIPGGDPAELCRDFIERAHRFHANSYREGRPFRELERLLAIRFSPAAPPAECRNLPEHAWIDLQEGEFRLYGVGRLVRLTEDPTASNHWAAVMPGNHTQWAVQYKLDAAIVRDFPKARVLVVVRARVRTPRGAALRTGVWCEDAHRPRTERTVSAQSLADGAWHTVDLGVTPLSAHDYVWVAPVNAPDSVPEVAVDRIILCRPGE